MSLSRTRSQLAILSGKCISFKKQAKKQWGIPSEWPEYVRARYEDMKAQARECRAQMGAAA